MNTQKKEAMLLLINGQRRYGSIMNEPENGSFQFLSFLNEQLFGTENYSIYLETIKENEVLEIDLCLK